MLSKSGINDCDLSRTFYDPCDVFLLDVLLPINPFHDVSSFLLSIYGALPMVILPLNLPSLTISLSSSVFCFFYGHSFPKVFCLLCTLHHTHLLLLASLLLIQSQHHQLHSNPPHPNFHLPTPNHLSCHHLSNQHSNHHLPNYFPNLSQNYQYSILNLPINYLIVGFSPINYCHSIHYTLA
jgi:hypothetical protein